MSSNTYKGTTRDGKRYLTKNGEIITNYFIDWGWFGSGAYQTAKEILLAEYGINTADQFASKLARTFLATCPEEDFTLTSGQIAFLIDN